MSDESKDLKKICLATVEVKVSELPELKSLLKALSENFESLPFEVKKALSELVPDVVGQVKERELLGAVVRLNSGSCEMTVTNVTNGELIELSHFIPEHGVMSEPFFVPYKCVYRCD